MRFGTDAVDCLGVKYNHETVIEMFKTRGWFPNVNCDDQFNADDARNFAGWIVHGIVTGKQIGRAHV